MSKSRYELIWRWDIRDSEDAEEEGEQDKALLAGAGGAGKKNYQGGGDVAGKLKCYRCHGEGHKISVCPSKDPRTQHRGAGSGQGAGNLGRGGGGGNMKNIKRFQGNCFRCGKFGHRIEDCEQQEDENAGKGKRNQDQHQTANTATSFAYGEGDSEEVIGPISCDGRARSGSGSRRR